MQEFCQKNCLPCEGGVKPLSNEEVHKYLENIPHWQHNEEKNSILREFKFKDFHQTMAFINAVAWIAHQENHHPDIEFGYNYCRIAYQTHAISGISENDLICASKINILLGN